MLINPINKLQTPMHLPTCQKTPTPLLSKLPIHTLEILQKALESKHTESRIQTPSRRTNTMHTQLGDPTINRADSRSSTQHGPHSATTTTIIANLEDLKFGIDFPDAHVAVDTALEDSCGDGVGGHVSV